MNNLAVSKKIILLEIDIGQDHGFWVNWRPGVWMMNLENSYPSDPEVSADYLLGASAMTNFTRVGSVQEDKKELTRQNSLTGVWEDDASFYWDSDNHDLYIHLGNGDEPQIHTITVGVVYGFSRQGDDYDDFLFEGRLTVVPGISKSRDPLFFGKISFDGGSAEILNADGKYDTLAESADIYGQKARILIGYNDDVYNDFSTIFEGMINKLSIGQESVRLQIYDKRKKLTKAIDYVATAANAVQCIREILGDEYGLAYDDASFNTAEWDEAETASPNISCNYEDESVINIIEEISQSILGYFIVQDDGRYTYRIYDSSRAVDQEIFDEDVMNRISLEYDPTEVVSSMKIGYAPVFASAGTTYTYLNYDDEEEAVYNKYRIYKQKIIDTLLPTEAEAQSFVEEMMNLSSSVKRTFTVTTNMVTADREIGDVIFLPIMRISKKMLGLVKGEIIGKEYDLENFNITLTCRIMGFIGVPGYWCTDTIAFPSRLGGVDAGTWDASWTKAQKEYASEHFGYWQDDEDIDPSDDDSHYITGWRDD